MLLALNINKIIISGHSGAIRHLLLVLTIKKKSGKTSALR